jgi:hypothetical protein
LISFGALVLPTRSDAGNRQNQQSGSHACRDQNLNLLRLR